VNDSSGSTINDFLDRCQSECPEGTLRERKGKIEQINEFYSWSFFDCDVAAMFLSSDIDQPVESSSPMK
jgi:hypothetical protein